MRKGRISKSHVDRAREDKDGMEKRSKFYVINELGSSTAISLAIMIFGCQLAATPSIRREPGLEGQMQPACPHKDL
jgi:hypothetical protein